MDIESILRESRAELLLEPLGFETEAGKSQFQKQIRHMSSNLGILQRRQDTISSIRSLLLKEEACGPVFA